MPHIIACRATNPVKDKVREKISMYTNVPMRRVVTMHDVESIYTHSRGLLHAAGIDREVLTLLNLHDRVDQGNGRPGPPAMALVRRPHRQAPQDSHASPSPANTPPCATPTPRIIKAAEHCGVHLGVNVNLNGSTPPPSTPPTSPNAWTACHGIIVPGGFGVRGTEGKIECIRYARENKMPYLGLCLGFQMAVIEYARNVCGIDGANSTEFEPACPDPVIDILPEQKKIEGLGGNMRLGGKDVELKPGTLAATTLRQRPHIRLRFRHRYEVDPKYIADPGRARPGLQRQASDPADHADFGIAARRASLSSWAPRPIPN